MSNEFDLMLKTLNEAFEADPAAINALLCVKIPCTDKLVNHETIIVSEMVLEPKIYGVGFLGLLNGMLEKATGRKIATKWTDTKDEQGRYTMLGFCEYQK